MRKIVIKLVPKKRIRNKGVGDYRKTKNGLEILSAKVGDSNFEKGVMIHEFTEALLAEKSKIPFDKINNFDKKHIDSKGEPGEMKDAPYKKQHAVANKIEKILVKALKDSTTYHESRGKK